MLFRQTFTMPLGSDYQGSISTTTDNGSTIYLNGVQVGTTNNWGQMYTFDLSPYLVPGKNVLAVAAVNWGGPGGMTYLANISLHAVQFPILPQWQPGTDMPAALAGGQAVAGSDGLIYYMGGRSFDGSQWNVSSAMWAYDPTAQTWSPKADLPATLERFAAAATTDGHIYAIGGCADNAGTTCSTNTAVYEYDIASNAWTDAPSLPSPGGCCSAAAVGPDGHIYVFGGDGGSTTTLAYDPSNPGAGWVQLADMPQGVQSGAATTGPDGRIYVMGSETPGSGAPVAMAQAYTVPDGNGGGNTWTTLTAPPMAVADDAAVIGPDGRVYVVGGTHGLDPNDPQVVMRYDTAADSWAFVASMTTGRTFPGVAMGPGGQLYAMGGYTADGSASASMEVYGPRITLDSHAERRRADGPGHGRELLARCRREYLLGHRGDRNTARHGHHRRQRQPGRGGHNGAG